MAGRVTRFLFAILLCSPQSAALFARNDSPHDAFHLAGCRTAISIKAIRELLCGHNEFEMAMVPV